MNYQEVKNKYGKPKPILFNTEMVQAILAGKKTQTRRPVKVELGLADFQEDNIYVPDKYGDYYEIIEYSKIHKGDILYIRETFSTDKNGDYVYRTNYGSTEDDSFPPSMFKWRPSIHMPKEAARLFLKVTDVKVERVQDIKIEDIISEGLEGYIRTSVDDVYTKDEYELRHEYAELWDDIYKLKGYGWDDNPWVWVIEFERLKNG